MTDIDALLAERRKTHGDYTVHAHTTQQMLCICMGTPNWSGLTSDQKETLHMIAHKIGRILAGNPEEPDHWDDIAGYAKLTADRCRGRK